MARGFRAVTLFRLEEGGAETDAFRAESAVDWVNGILDERRSGRFDSTP
jgi:hypothetical protein